ncbi:MULTISPECIES: hypothetical protein [Streptomyces]|uniref:Uncharacterized protein n=2 Tax=Streptomyces TaxID=1883 RepID=A0A2N8PIX6_STRNR|nr:MULTISPECIES: hypothetical protein [Streptomyces]PNE40981.1 hypothetical protein AOB60_09525 [Streptomyces noursei]SHN09954.1 hypothetical protein SAMN05216268_119169 [Streptomyces yunnanensis]
MTGLQRDGGEREGRRRIPFGAIGLTLALACSIAGIVWTAGLDETGVEVAPPSGDTLRPAATPAPPPSPHRAAPSRP